MDTINLIRKSTDLVVVGGGLAGTFAAIAAARLGSEVVLIQERPVLGGNSSSEIRVHPVGASQHGYHRDARETGLIEEAFLKVRSRSYGLRQINGRHYPMWDVVLEEMVRAEPTLTLHLNTRVIDVQTEAADGGYERKITHLTAVQQGTEAVYEYTPRMVIDATGDGFVALRAGAGFRYGREAKSEFNEMWAPEEADDIVLGSTIMFAARDTSADAPFVAPEWAHRFPDEESLPYRNHEEFHSGYWWLEWGGTTHTIHNNENIRHELQSAVLGVWDHIKNHCTVPGVRERARTWSLDWIGHVPGKRESRRFLGDYFMTEADILRGINVVPNDVVAYGGWPIDLHAPDGVYSRDEPCTQPPLPDLYGIPLGSLCSNTVANLLYAGRNISQSHVAHGSTRVMKTTSVVGEAAGVAAHVALAHDLTPRGAATTVIGEVQQQLLRQGAYLPRMRNTDTRDLVQAGGVEFSTTSRSALALGLVTSTGAAAWDQAGLSLAESQIFGDADQNATKAIGLDVPLAQSIVVSSGRIDRLNLGLRNPSDAPVVVNLTMRQAIHLRDCGGKDPLDSDLYAAAITIAAGASVDWITFTPPLVCQPDAPIVIVAAAEGPAEWMLTPHEPPGTQAATWDTELGYWRWLHGTFDVALDPVSSPFGPEQVASGVTRPETATNMWISDPAQSLPQSLTITWPEVIDVSSVHLTFDSQLSGWIWEGSFPMIAKRYSVEGRTVSGAWTSLVDIDGNVLRCRVHTFAPVAISALRITIHETHGGATARIVEVRAYHDEGR